ncbi:myo-inositol catabolism protein IolC [Microbacterium sp. W4I4]|uniref:2-deoxy-5-keto-D-gluconate 6-phosphate aldolase domain-containing protein n=1 Tax=Microbacterium sp. W4I4 TaxID=3042295 RepID=UPI00278B3DCD|nr:DUF2090 domain-containing protein [Microbacterium sp. W4I4]MDQ0615024.1 myo-inositol catabolism protein IolC [Microbacterium sp. W4I4]
MFSPEPGAMGVDDDTPIALLAFDHRERNFSSVRPTGMTDDEIRRSKELIFDAFEVVVEGGLHGVRPGIIVDEEFGAPLARRAVESGIAVAMPVEKASQDVFTFEYGDAFREHLREFRPAFAKALVRYRVTDPADHRRIQRERLRELSDFVAGEPIALMLELIVGQRADGPDAIPTVDVDGLCASMAELQDAGVHVDVWKVEGTSSQEDAAQIVAQARLADANARCVVLGAGAPRDTVSRWLDVSAATPGYGGFAIGRSIWGESIVAWLDGTRRREQAIEEIASTCRRWAQQYVGERIR